VPFETDKSWDTDRGFLARDRRSEIPTSPGKQIWGTAEHRKSAQNQRRFTTVFYTGLEGVTA
jgi:hypothetical protein